MPQKIPNPQFSHLTKNEIKVLRLDNEYEIAFKRRERAAQVELDKGLNPDGRPRPRDGHID